MQTILTIAYILTGGLLVTSIILACSVIDFKKKAKEPKTLVLNAKLWSDEMENQVLTIVR